MAAELHTLEQRLLLVGDEVEDAGVELDPRQLAVEETGLVVGRRRGHRGDLAGVPDVPLLARRRADRMRVRAPVGSVVARGR